MNVELIKTLYMYLPILINLALLGNRYLYGKSLLNKLANDFMLCIRSQPFQYSRYAILNRIVAVSRMQQFELQSTVTEFLAADEK